ncbi:hypothetical protein M422DRAFT_55860 [Sphaerobolus stellatus SS14]|uniref:Uncharacterized protein n=1 Tax=Sphaerobolus stellatus (strain SS14) TaxID=990650 RepID=A0A0C9T9F0_SPHS4|nr:hypothetical protein M422DRAFT_55860 [Sphaerobolus stellatus SS14]
MPNQKQIKPNHDISGVLILSPEKRCRKPYQEPVAMTEMLKEILPKASENSVGDGSQLGAILELLNTLALSPVNRQSIHKHITASISKVTFKEVAPFFYKP